MTTTPATETKTTFKIPAANLAGLREKIAKLNRKATKLSKKGYDFKPVEMVEDPTPVVEIEYVRFDRDGFEIVPARKVERIYFYVEVKGEPVNVNGWTFIGTLQHEAEGTIVRGVPGSTREGELAAFRDAAPACDHCGYRRYRKDSFVVRFEATGEHKQVGRNCLADFIGGRSPQAAAEAAEYLQAFYDAAGAAEDEGWEGGARGERMASLESFLGYVTCTIREDGWLSRTAAREQDRSSDASADKAWSFGCFPSFGMKEEDKLHPVEADHALAKSVIEWAEAHFEAADTATLSDYEHNLRVALLSGVVSYRTAGIIASVVKYAQRAWGQEQERKARAERKPSEYVGTVGVREVFRSLTVKSIHSFDSDFGVRNLIRFEDEAGNVLTWWTGDYSTVDFGTALDVRENPKTVNVKATVKKHEDYKGVKQTVLSRVALATEKDLAPKKTRAKKA